MAAPHEDPTAAPHEDPTAAFADVAALLDLDDTQFDTLKVLGRALHVNEADLGQTLEAILRSATSVIRCADHAGVNLLVRDRLEPQATLGSAPPRLDALQQRSGVGPCFDASREQCVITVADMACESRWPEFASTAVELEVHSMLCVPLWVDERRLGSVSLYSATTQAFDAAAVQLADLYATHAAVALADAQRTDQLRRAMASRDVIGQAKGVLMERHRITGDEAFEMLKQASRRANRKLVDVAEILAATGELPQPSD